MITNLMNKYVKKLIKDLIEDSIKNGEGNYNIISLDFDLLCEHTFPLYNGKCHINSLATFHKLKNIYYYVDVYFCLLVASNEVFAHFIVGIKESKDSNLKFIDPTLGIMGLYKTKYVLFKDDEKTDGFISLFEDEELFSDVKELKKHPDNVLFTFKGILIRNLVSRFKRRSKIKGWFIEKMITYLLSKGYNPV